MVSKKSNNAINIISWISITAIAITTAALIIILSAMNGLTGTVANLYNVFEPDLKVTVVKGKYFEANDKLVSEIKAIDGVKIISKTLEWHVINFTSETFCKDFVTLVVNIDCTTVHMYWQSFEIIRN